MEEVRIEKYISDLLYHHNCVIIPQFGGFVANYSSAKIDPLLNKFSPPSKLISFNKNLQNNDGLLTNHISVEKSISYDKAGEEIKKWIVFANSVLNSGSKVSMEKIGTLFIDINQKLCFEPDYSVNYLKESFGLSEFFAPFVSIPNELAVSDKDLSTESIPAIKEEEKTQPKIISITKPGRIKIALQYAAIALFIPMISYALWIGYNMDMFKQSSFTSANLNPFTEKICSVYNKRNPVEKVSVEEPIFSSSLFDDSVDVASLSLLDSGDPNYSESDRILVKLKTNELAIPISTKVITKNPTSFAFGFHVIGGCFAIYKNAEKLVSKLKNLGFDSEIIDRNKGLFRVSYGSYASHEEAEIALASAKSKHNENAWILVK